MEKEEEPMEVEDPNELESLEFPTSNLSRIQTSASGKTVRWIEIMGATEKDPTVYARILQCYDSHPEQYNDFFGLIGIQNIMPMAVHTSPLYAMLSRSDDADAYKDRFISSFTSIKYLNQLLFHYRTTHVAVAQQTAISGLNETETERIQGLSQEYMKRYQQAKNALFDDLMPLYRVKPAPPEALAAFYSRMVRYTYDYIHLLEYIIWKIVDPAERIALEYLLTPAVENIPQPPSDREWDVIVRTFALKSAANNQNLTMAGCAHLVKNWFPTLLEKGAWINNGLLENYFHFMNVEDV